MASSGSASPAAAPQSPQSPVTPPRGAKRPDKAAAADRTADSEGKAGLDEESRMRARLLAKLEEKSAPGAGTVVERPSGRSAKRTVRLLDGSTERAAARSPPEAQREDLGEMGPGIRPPQTSAAVAGAGGKYEQITITVGGSKDKAAKRAATTGDKPKERVGHAHRPEATSTASAAPKRPSAEHQAEAASSRPDKKESKRTRHERSSPDAPNSRQRRINEGWAKWKRGELPPSPPPQQQQQQQGTAAHKHRRRDREHRKRPTEAAAHGRQSHGDSRSRSPSHHGRGGRPQPAKSASAREASHRQHQQQQPQRAGDAPRKSHGRRSSGGKTAAKEAAGAPRRPVKPMESVFAPERPPSREAGGGGDASAERKCDLSELHATVDAGATPVMDEPSYGSDASDREPMEEGERHDSQSPAGQSPAAQSSSPDKKPAARPKYSKFESSPESSRAGDEADSDAADGASGHSSDGDGQEGQDEGDTPKAPDRGDDVEMEQSGELDITIEDDKVSPSGDVVCDKDTRLKQLIDSLPMYYPAVSGCRSVEEFHCLNRIEEGTFGVVYRAQEKRTDEVVALKRLKMEKEKEGFPITSLREINMLLKAGRHENVVNVREIVVGSNMDKIYLVMDYVEHDMKSLMESLKQKFAIGEVKTLLQQLLRGVHHLHDNWILHRDLKTSNLLLSHRGILKIADFGLAREYGSPLKQYTAVVVTLWYRAPELLLGTKLYSTHVDMWSVGVILAEFLTLKPLFPAKGEMDAINRIFRLLGTPNTDIWPEYADMPAAKKTTLPSFPYNSLRKCFDNTLSQTGFSLLNRFLTYNPVRRTTAWDALKDDWFTEEPRPTPPQMFPTWPARSELGGKKAAAGAQAAGAGDKQQQQAKAAGQTDAGDDKEKAAKPDITQASPKADDKDKELLSALKVQPSQAAQGFSLKFDAPKFH